MSPLHPFSVPEAVRVPFVCSALSLACPITSLEEKGDHHLHIPVPQLSDF